MADDAAIRPPSAAPPQPLLAPLACPSCARAVAIGVGDTARCRACGTEAPIPEPYLRLRAAAALDDVARARAEAIGAELARPPSRLMRSWRSAGALASVLASVLLGMWLLVSLVMCIGTFASGGPLGALIMLVVGLFLGVPLLFDELLHGLAGTLGVDLADAWGGVGAYGLLAVSCYLITVVPRVLAAYAESFESVRTGLRHALAANPAATPGGAAGCHGCGAPLDVPAERLHARCLYCGTDNLVHLADGQLADLERDGHLACTDLESAIAQQHGAARRGRRRVVTQLVAWLALVPVCIVLGRGVAGVNRGGATFWHRATVSAPMLPNLDDNPPLPRGTATVFDVHDSFDGCDEVDCWAYYFVALEAGDVLRLGVDGGDLRVVEVAGREVGPWYDPTYAWRPLDPEAGAAHAAWYRVKLATAKRRGAEPRVTWDVGR